MGTQLHETLDEPLDRVVLGDHRNAEAEHPRGLCGDRADGRRGRPFQEAGEIAFRHQRCQILRGGGAREHDVIEAGARHGTRCRSGGHRIVRVDLEDIRAPRPEGVRQGLAGDAGPRKQDAPASDVAQQSGNGIRDVFSGDRVGRQAVPLQGGPSHRTDGRDAGAGVPQVHMQRAGTVRDRIDPMGAREHDPVEGGPLLEGLVEGVEIRGGIDPDRGEGHDRGSLSLEGVAELRDAVLGARDEDRASGERLVVPVLGLVHQIASRRMSSAPPSRSRDATASAVARQASTGACTTARTTRCPSGDATTA